MTIERIVGDIREKNILLLQGPMGSFFNRLDKRFQKAGAYTFRIGLNAGDELFSKKKNFTSFKLKPDKWEYFIQKYYIKNSINTVFIFGDCRFYQKIASKVAKALNIDVYVFEEGYIRPNFVTLEKYGVNAFSQIPRKTSFYKNFKVTKKLQKEMGKVKKFNFTFYKLAAEAIAYYIISSIFRAKYPNYVHHRCFSVKEEFRVGCTNFFRKQRNRVTEWGMNKEFMTKYHKKYFFVPLQTYGDFQILEHSTFNTIEHFIAEIITSFTNNASKESYIVFKHHPVDRGKKDYTQFIMAISKMLGVENRVLIVWDTHLPTMLKNAIGTIVVNSTVGLSSLYHNTPTLCLGNAIYDIKGLTSKGMGLNEFWQGYKEVDSKLFQKFRAYLISTTQVNDSFYRL